MQNIISYRNVIAPGRYVRIYNIRQNIHIIQSVLQYRVYCIFLHGSVPVGIEPLTLATLMPCLDHRRTVLV